MLSAAFLALVFFAAADRNTIHLVYGVWPAERSAIFCGRAKAGRVGRHLRYDPADVTAWFRQQQEAA
jgi:hypothetical protein